MIVHTCCLIVTTRDNALMRVYYYLMRTMGLGDEQDGFGCFPLSNRTEKVPPGAGRYTPPHKSEHNDILCTDSKGNQAKQDKPAGRSLAAVLLCFARGAVFGVLHCPNTAQKQSHNIIAYKTKSKSKRYAYIYNTHIHIQKQERSPKSI